MRFERKNPFIGRTHGCGVFVGSMYYDGISGRVRVAIDDAGNHESVDVFPGHGDRVWREKGEEK